MLLHHYRFSELPTDVLIHISRLNMNIYIYIYMSVLSHI